MSSSSSSTMPMKQRPPVRPRHLSKTPQKQRLPPLADAISETESGTDSLALTLPTSNHKHQQSTKPTDRSMRSTSCHVTNKKNVDNDKYYAITEGLYNNLCHNNKKINHKQQFGILNNAKNHISKVMNNTYQNMNTMLDRTTRTLTLNNFSTHSSKRRREQQKKKKLILGDGLLYDVQGNVISDDTSVSSPNSLLGNDKGLDRYVPQFLGCIVTVLLLDSAQILLNFTFSFHILLFFF
jgi:hypothetical protein